MPKIIPNGPKLYFMEVDACKQTLTYSPIVALKLLQWDSLFAYQDYWCVLYSNVAIPELFKSEYLRQFYLREFSSNLSPGECASSIYNAQRNSVVNYLLLDMSSADLQVNIP